LCYQPLLLLLFLLCAVPRPQELAHAQRLFATHFTLLLLVIRSACLPFPLLLPLLVLLHQMRWSHNIFISCLPLMLSQPAVQTPTAACTSITLLQLPSLLVISFILQLN
jgi:hypothetical protein